MSIDDDINDLQAQAEGTLYATSVMRLVHLARTSVNEHGYSHTATAECMALDPHEARIMLAACIATLAAITAAAA